MNLPSYNPDGKKLTFEQHLKKQKEYEERQLASKPTGTTGRPGRCEKCNGSSFTLKVESGSLIRTCKNQKCEDQQFF